MPSKQASIFVIIEISKAIRRTFWFFLTYYAKLTIKMPSKQASIFVIIEISKAIRRTFY